MLSWLGGGPSCVCDVVAQLASARLRISRRAFRPPSIDVPLSFAAFQFDRLEVSLEWRFAFQDPQHDSKQSAQRRQDAGDHGRLFARKLGQKIDDLLERPFWLVARDKRGHGSHGSKQRSNCAKSAKPINFQ